MTKTNNTIGDRNHGTKLTSLRPLVDVYENSDGIVLMADLPGVNTEQLEIQVEGDVLSLEAKPAFVKVEDATKQLEMIPEGVYRRSFNLGDGLDFKQIDAELKSGLLTITVPKKISEAPQKISVRAA